MKNLLAVALAVVGLTTASAQTPTAVTVEITQFGIYEATVTGSVEASGTAAGRVQGVNYNFVSTTTAIPACKGVRFGFEYRVMGEPAGASISIRSVTLFPADGVRNPKSGQQFSRSEYMENREIGAVSLKGYSLDDDWEAVPGQWVQQVWYGDTLLAEKRFTLMKSCSPISLAPGPILRAARWGAQAG